MVGVPFLEGTFKHTLCFTILLLFFPKVYRIGVVEEPWMFGGLSRGCVFLFTIFFLLILISKPSLVSSFQCIGNIVGYF